MEAFFETGANVALATMPRGVRLYNRSIYQCTFEELLATKRFPPEEVEVYREEFFVMRVTSGRTLQRATRCCTNPASMMLLSLL